MSIKKHLLQLPNLVIEEEEEPEFDCIIPSAIKLIQIEISPNKQQLSELQQLKYLIDDKQYFSAYQMKQELFHSYSNDYEYLNYTKDIFELIDDDIEEIKELTKWFELQDGWSIQQQDSRMQIRYQQLPNSPRVVARIDTEIKIPLDIFISLIYETELYPQWFPFCKDSKTILQPDKATKILHMHSSPPVISDRELCVKGWGVNNLEYDGSVLILSHSIDKRTKLLKRYGYIYQYIFFEFLFQKNQNMLELIQMYFVQKLNQYLLIITQQVQQFVLIQNQNTYQTSYQIICLENLQVLCLINQYQIQKNIKDLYGKRKRMKVQNSMIG
ncbi:unnamed protein product [Paramecium pentaurelia]|uniref:Uncharacterized protein n=1 Tax=Paramecium pentaurelia TaxID=43138 RepID=A0A8S1Y7L4_9CILI|nr:unnamed protein product [Paramecium pentaurelia]